MIIQQKNLYSFQPDILPANIEIFILKEHTHFIIQHLYARLQLLYSFNNPKLHLQLRYIL